LIAHLMSTLRKYYRASDISSDVNERDLVANVTEQIVLVLTASHIEDIVRAQAANMAPEKSKEHFSDLKLGRSHHGRLARFCKKPEDTFKWFRDVEAAELDGSVEPLCFPDGKAGPDVLAVLRHQNQPASLPVFVALQVKNWINKAAPPKATLTTLPEFFFCENRKVGEKPKWSSGLRRGHRQEWRNLARTLFCAEKEYAHDDEDDEDDLIGWGNERRPIVRGVVELVEKPNGANLPGACHIPADTSHSKAEGRLVFTEETLSSRCHDEECTQNHDLVIQNAFPKGIWNEVVSASRDKEKY